MSDPIIPNGQIAWFVNRYHVGTDIAEIWNDLERRMTDPQWTDAQKQAAFDYALLVHNENRRTYNRVMTGQLIQDILE